MELQNGYKTLYDMSQYHLSYPILAEKADGTVCLCDLLDDYDELVDWQSLVNAGEQPVMYDNGIQLRIKGFNSGDYEDPYDINVYICDTYNNLVMGRMPFCGTLQEELRVQSILLQPYMDDQPVGNQRTIPAGEPVTLYPEHDNCNKYRVEPSDKGQSVYIVDTNGTTGATCEPGTAKTEGYEYLTYTPTTNQFMLKPRIGIIS